jgi:hypothetical protein
MNELIKAAANSVKEWWDADELADFINAATIVIAYAKSQGFEMVSLRSGRVGTVGNMMSI